MSNSVSTVFGPRVLNAGPTTILGNEIRLAVHLEGCKNLPRFKPASRVCRSFGVTFQTLSANGAPWVDSTISQEGERLFEGTVQWNSVLYLDCLELSLICIALYARDERGVSRRLCETSLTVNGFLASSELVLLPVCRDQEDTDCTIFLTASRVSDPDEERERGSYTDADTRNDLFPKYAPLIKPKAARTQCFSSWSIIMHQLSAFVDASGDLKVLTRGYWILWELYDAYRRCMGMGLQAYFPKIGALTTFLVTAVDAILASNRLRLSNAHMLDTKAVVSAIFDQIWYSANLIINYMYDQENHLSVGHRYFSDERKYGPQGADIEKVVANHGVELARLTWIIVAPNPTPGIRVTSTCDRHIVSGTLAKDVLLFTLEAVVHSGDAFPPLKSAASGLLFFANCAEMVTGNKKQIRSIYKRIDALASCLERGCHTDGSPLSPAHQEAVSTLAKDIAAINEDLDKIAIERKSHFVRYLCAKRHRHSLREILVQFEMSKTNYMTAVTTLNATTIAQVLAHVQALTLIAGARPVQMLGGNNTKYHEGLVRRPTGERRRT